MAVELDQSQTRDLVNALQAQAQTARHQWIVWLGVGAGGGVVALLSFAANLPDPDYALGKLVPSLAGYIGALVFAAPTMLLLSLELTQSAAHFAAAHNRDDLKAVIAGLPHRIASPPALEAKLNAERNHYIKQHDDEHKEAEDAWRWRSRWRALRLSLTAVSGLLFVASSAYPVFLICTKNRLVPPSVEHAKP